MHHRYHRTTDPPGSTHGKLRSLLLVTAGITGGVAVSQLLAAGIDRRWTTGARRLVRVYNAGDPADPYSDADAYRDDVTAIQQTTVGAPSDQPLGDEATRRRIPGVPTGD
jgi:hypothetical protein